MTLKVLALSVALVSSFSAVATPNNQNQGSNHHNGTGSPSNTSQSSILMNDTNVSSQNNLDANLYSNNQNDLSAYTQSGSASDSNASIGNISNGSNAFSGSYVGDTNQAVRVNTGDVNLGDTNQAVRVNTGDTNQAVRVNGGETNQTIGDTALTVGDNVQTVGDTNQATRVNNNQSVGDNTQAQNNRNTSAGNRTNVGGQNVSFNNSYKSGAITGAPGLGSQFTVGECKDSLGISIGGGTPYYGSGGVGFQSTSKDDECIKGGRTHRETMQKESHKHSQTVVGMQTASNEKVETIKGATKITVQGMNHFCNLAFNPASEKTLSTVDHHVCKDVTMGAANFMFPNMNKTAAHKH